MQTEKRTDSNGTQNKDMIVDKALNEKTFKKTLFKKVRGNVLEEMKAVKVDSKAADSCIYYYKTKGE